MQKIITPLLLEEEQLKLGHLVKESQLECHFSILSSFYNPKEHPLEF